MIYTNEIFFHHSVFKLYSHIHCNTAGYTCRVGLSLLRFEREIRKLRKAAEAKVWGSGNGNGKDGGKKRRRGERGGKKKLVMKEPEV